MTTPQEQLMLELINRARMNPAAEAARQGIDLNQGLAPGTISTAPKQVLAMSDQLVLAADNHSKWMLHNDQFNHQEPLNFPTFRTGLNPGDRMTAAGYVFAGPITSNGENISWIGSSGAVNATTSIIDQHRGLFLSPGHRTNKVSDTFREAGIGQELGTFPSNGTNLNASMVTQNFALSGTKVFVTGVVYNDTIVNDDFFTVGEQTAGRAVGGTGCSDAGAGGGYELGFATGAKAVIFNWPGRQRRRHGRTTNISSSSMAMKFTNPTRRHLRPVAELHALGIRGPCAAGPASKNSSATHACDARRRRGDAPNGGGAADLMVGRGRRLYRRQPATRRRTAATPADLYTSVTFSLANGAGLRHVEACADQYGRDHRLQRATNILSEAGGNGLIGGAQRRPSVMAATMG